MTEVKMKIEEGLIFIRRVENSINGLKEVLARTKMLESEVTKEALKPTKMMEVYPLFVRMAKECNENVKMIHNFLKKYQEVLKLERLLTNRPKKGG